MLLLQAQLCLKNLLAGRTLLQFSATKDVATLDSVKPAAQKA